MILLNRYFGQWLDQNKSDDYYETIAKAYDVMSSSIYLGFRHPELEQSFEEALISNSYAYAVPKEISVNEINPNNYYRYEVQQPNYVGNEKLSFYGKGNFILEHYKYFDHELYQDNEIHITIYEYLNHNDMMLDLKEECYVLNKTVFSVAKNHSISPVYWNDDTRQLVVAQN